jgi:hypothetical protein
MAERNGESQQLDSGSGILKFFRAKPSFQLQLILKEFKCATTGSFGSAIHKYGKIIFEIYESKPFAHILLNQKGSSFSMLFYPFPLLIPLRRKSLAWAALTRHYPFSKSTYSFVGQNTMKLTICEIWIVIS